MFNLTRQYLQSLGLPGEDLGNLPTSIATLDDDVKFWVEILTVDTAETVLQLAR